MSRKVYPVRRHAVAAALIAVTGIPVSASPLAILWTAPLMLTAAMMIAWGAEAAQFFMAQGIALAILAWLQTLPEFAVEAVLAWRQQTPLLIANLAGALQLLTGLGWPMIYAAAWFAQRRRAGGPFRGIRLGSEHAVQIVGLLFALLYAFVIWAKGSVEVFDALVLFTLYALYLVVLRKLPATDRESIADLPAIPRSVVRSTPLLRILSIGGLFGAGGALIYWTAEPFLASVLAVASSAGIAQFVAIKWIAPFVSEFPEKVSALKWASSEHGASTALMNMVSSNINQWTLLLGMLPLVLSLSRGHAAGIQFDSEQSLELLVTLSQCLLGLLFLMDMKLAWWEALGLFVLWLIQFGFSIAPPEIARAAHLAVAYAYLAWCVVEVGRVFLGQRRPQAFIDFARVWREHVK